MQVLLLKLTESTCGCCEMLFATECRGFHAAERGDGVSTLGSPHRPALSRPAKRLSLCVRPGLGEKDHIIAPWPRSLCSPVHNFLTTRKCLGLFCLFVCLFEFHPKVFFYNHAAKLNSECYKKQKNKKNTTTLYIMILGEFTQVL